MADIVKRPGMGEIATDERGTAFNKIMVNDDTVLQTRGGGDLTIYQELLRDDQVASTFQQRRRAVISAEWEVIPASESAQDQQAAAFIKEQLDRIKFDALTDKMLYGVFYGYSVAEWLFAAEDNRIVLRGCKVRDRSRFRFGTDGELYLLTMQNPMGEKMDRAKFWTLTTGGEHDDQPYGLGLAHHLYWPVFFKRNGMKYWAVFLEKFGQPTPAARLPQGQMNDESLKQKALEALQAIQVDSGVLIPDGVIIELIEAARSGTADYQGLIDKMDAAISKIVLSQTMTTDNGSSRSQAEVHADVRDEVVKADADLICESLNDSIIPYLTALNFPNAQPPKVWRKTEPEADLMQRVEIDKGIHALGFEPTEDYIRATYGDGWVKRQSNPSTAPAGINQGGLSFAENSLLAGAVASRRADMETLTRVAEGIAAEYQEVLGKRVSQLLAYAEESGDLETFRQRLNEMLTEGPQQDTVEAVANATWASRLMGMLRAQR